MSRCAKRAGGGGWGDWAFPPPPTLHSDSFFSFTQTRSPNPQGEPARRLGKRLLFYAKVLQQQNLLCQFMMTLVCSFFNKKNLKFKNAKIMLMLGIRREHLIYIRYSVEKILLLNCKIMPNACATSPDGCSDTDIQKHGQVTAAHLLRKLIKLSCIL